MSAERFKVMGFVIIHEVTLGFTVTFLQDLDGFSKLQHERMTDRTPKTAYYWDRKEETTVKHRLSRESTAYKQNLRKNNGRWKHWD